MVAGYNGQSWIKQLIPVGDKGLFSCNKEKGLIQRNKALTAFSLFTDNVT
jgi:hypothetical protein